MQETHQSKNEPTSGAYRFTGADLAAIRLVELIFEHPSAKQILETMTKGQEEWHKGLQQLVELMPDLEKRAQLASELEVARPTEEIKNVLTKFIGSNFEIHQIEYAINLVTDQRLPDLIKRGSQVIETLVDRLASKLNSLAHELDRPR